MNASHFPIDKSFTEEEKEKERRLQDATISIKKKYGKNALLKGISFTEGATGKERNRQIGGHNA